jgi:WD40 repeat protein
MNCRYGWGGVVISIAIAAGPGFAADELPPGALARLGSLRLRHADSVNAVAFSPDSKLLASASGSERHVDCSARVWDVATGEERLRLVHKFSVYCVAFSPNGKTIATGGKDAAVIFWDAATGREIRRIDEQTGFVESIAYSPDGKLIASVSMNSNVARLWDVDTGKEVRQFTGDGRELKTVAISPDGTKIAAGGGGSITMMWDVKTGETVRTFGQEHRPGSGAALVFSPDGKLLATSDGTVYVYEVATGRDFGEGFELRRGDKAADRLIFSPDGKALVLACHDGNIRIWDYVADRELKRFRAGAWRALAGSPDGKRLATSGGNVVHIWETASGVELHAEGPQGQIFFVGFGPGGKTAFVDGGGLYVWDLARGKEVIAANGRRGQRLPGNVNVIGMSPDGKILASGGYSAQVRFFDAGTGKESREFPALPIRPAIRAVFTSDGKQVVLLNEDMRTMSLWDLRTGKEVSRFAGHSSPVDAMAVSPDGKRLISSGTPRAMIRQPPPGFVEDTGARVWDMVTGKELRQFPSRDQTFAFSPDGTLLAAGNDGGVRLLDPATGNMIRQLEGPKYSTYGLAFSPDGKSLTAVGRDKAVWLWEVATGSPRRNFVGHAGEILGVAYSPDGRRILSGGTDTVAFLWDAYAIEKPATDLTKAAKSLESADGTEAYRAICALVADPDRAVSVVASAVQPVEAPDPQRLSRLIADLDSASFTGREKATTELAKLADAAEPALRELLAGRPSPEARGRAVKVLEGLKTFVSPALLRGLRSVEILEAIAMPAARVELERLAGGATGMRLTRDARSALDRLTAREEPRWKPPAAMPRAEAEALLGGPVRGGVDADGKPLPQRAIARFGTLQEPGKSSVRYVPSQDARLAVVFRYDLPTIRILELPSGRERQAIKSPARSGWFTEAAFSPDGTKLAADNSNGADRSRRLYVWDVATGKELWQSGGGVSGLGSLAWSRDNKMVATSGGEPRTLRVWDAVTGKEIRSWSSPYNHTMISFSDDNKKLVAVWPKRRTLDIETGNEIAIVDGAPEGGMPGIRPRPAPKIPEWSATELKGPLVFEPATGELRLQPKGHPPLHDIFYIQFSTDGRTAVSADNHGLMFVWDLTGLAPDGTFPTLHLIDADRAGLWRLLAEDDAPLAYRAAWRLVAGGDETTAFIRTKLQPVPRDIGPQVEKLIVNLAATDEATRQAAMQRLDEIGPPAAAALRTAAARQSRGETGDRIAYLLDNAERTIPSGGLLRAIRAVEVLKRIGSPAARAVLGELAAGLPDTVLTQVAAKAMR